MAKFFICDLNYSSCGFNSVGCDDNIEIGLLKCKTILEVCRLMTEGLVIQDESHAYYFVSGFSHPHLPIVKHDGIFSFEWGLIPFWTKDNKAAKDIQNMTLNAVG